MLGAKPLNRSTSSESDVTMADHLQHLLNARPHHIHRTLNDIFFFARRTFDFEGLGRGPRVGPSLQLRTNLVKLHSKRS